MMPETLPIEIDVQGVKALLDHREQFLLIDCREPAEMAIARLAEAKPISMGDVARRIAELEEFRDKRIVVHCHYGQRSLIVTEWLRAQGFAFAQNMTGGIDAWSRQIDANIPRY
jgi:rhodanese-related sulfurtransferase